MNLFADYIQPLTAWLQTNPHWSLCITFLIALVESLVIIGIIIPGSVTMTAIGILAGSGIMRLDLTLIAATLGAVCGDSISYAIGYYYSEQLVYIWPFTKYPKWLIYGKEFFARHGGKSVLIGRFVGPLRSVIPVIAGIMHMKQWRFLLSNLLSAIGWSILYIMPGALIGAASHGLSAEVATRLFLLILLILAGIWLASLLIKWLFIKLNLFLKNNLHCFWMNFEKKGTLRLFYNALTPIEESNHYPTAALSLLTFTSFLFFIVLTILSIKPQWLNFINLPINLFMRSFHTALLEAFFIVCTQLTSTISIISLYIICCLWFIYNKQLKSITYVSSLIISSGFIAIALAYLIDSPRPQGLLVTMPGSSFPIINLVIATTFYVFILFYINNKYSLLTNTLRTFILIMLGLSGFGAIYLGDVWFTDVLASYFVGGTICLVHYLMYRKLNLKNLKAVHSSTIIFTLIAGILCSTALSTYLNFINVAHDHTPYHKEYILNKSTWWNQQTPILPLYRLNRIGNRISLLNIQYIGDLDLLQKSLERKGWELHTESFFTKLLMRMSSNSNEIKFPLLAQLYENKSPQLIMTYKDNYSKIILELNIWKSNYYISELRKSLWIGTVHQNPHNISKKNRQEKALLPLINPITYIIPSLSKFTLRRIEVPKNIIKSSLFPTTPTILLIKDYDIDK